MVLRGNRLAGLLIAVSAATSLSACGGSAVKSSPGVSCSNYALSGNGQYRNEASVRVQVSNSTTRAARYAVDVAITTSHSGAGGAPSAHVTIEGSVAPHASAELGRKVLTAYPVQRCRLTRITRLSGS